MLPPHELKNKGFSHAIRGYSVAEVDDYIEFLLDRYADLYRRNDQLEKELRIANVRLEELTVKEDAINRALVNAQRLEEKIINDAANEAELITRAAKTNADKILNDFHRKVARERETLHTLRCQVAQFKDEVLSQYNSHIEAINALAPGLDREPEWENDADDYTRQVLEGIRSAAENASETMEKKNKLDKIMQAHSVEKEEIPSSKVETELTPSEPEVTVQAAVVPAESGNDDAAEKLPLIEKKLPKRRPRARRTFDKLGSPSVQQNPIPPSPSEGTGDTEDALDRLFSDSSK